MIGDIPTKTSDLTNDSGYITNSALSGYVPTSRTINGKALSNDITLSASDVGALSSSTSYVSSVNGSSGAITNVAKTNSDNNFSTAQTFSTNGIKLAQATGSTNYYATLQGDASVTSNITLTLPSSTGTIALVSDIPSTSNFVTLSGTQTITGSKTFTTAQTFGEIVLSNINYSLNTGQFNDEFAWGHGKFLVEDIGDRTLINVNTDGDLEFPNGATANNICLSYEEDSSSDGSDGMLENIGDELYFNGDSVSGKIHTISLSGGSHSIWPNIYYILTGTSFTFTLLSGTAGILSEYMGEITTTAGTTLNFTGVTWIASGDNITVSGSNLTLASGHTYQFSIVSNCGLIVEF